MRSLSRITPSSSILAQRTTRHKDPIALLDCTSLVRTKKWMRSSSLITQSSSTLARRTTRHADALELIDCATLVRTARAACEVSPYAVGLYTCSTNDESDGCTCAAWPRNTCHTRKRRCSSSRHAQARSISVQRATSHTYALALLDCAALAMAQHKNICIHALALRRPALELCNERLAIRMHWRCLTAQH